MSIGYLLPSMFHKYIDDTQYLSVRYPISLDRYEYEKCDDQVLYSKYTSLIDLSVESHNELNKINDDGSFTVVFKEARWGNFLAGDSKNFSVVLQIPCDTEPGIYFWSGIKTYEVKNHKKNYSFITDSFEVQ